MEPLDEYHALIVQLRKTEEEIAESIRLAADLRRGIVIFLAQLEERIKSTKEELKEEER